MCTFEKCTFVPSRQDFRGTYRAIPAGPTPLAPIPSEHLRADLIWSRENFGPDFDPKRAISGPNQVTIGSNQVSTEVFGGDRCERGRSGWGGPVGPPESLDPLETRSPLMGCCKRGCNKWGLQGCLASLFESQP